MTTDNAILVLNVNWTWFIDILAIKPETMFLQCCINGNGGQQISTEWEVHTTFITESVSFVSFDAPLWNSIN